jgi:purine-binding chemotaxis protein CheW
MINQENAQSPSRRQFVTFVAADQEFCADIMSIREIRGWTDTTVLPHAPDHVLGVINLRGVVLPVIDLKCRLGMGKTSASPKHVIIVVAVGDRTVGLLVDAVSDIFYATPAEIQPAPEMARNALLDCIEGIAVFEKRMISIIGMGQLFSVFTPETVLAA